jgi:hypothetical protein
MTSVLDRYDEHRHAMDGTPLYEFDEDMQGFRAVPIDSRRWNIDWDKWSLVIAITTLLSGLVGLVGYAVWHNLTQ